MSKWLTGIKDAELFVEANKGISDRTTRELFVRAKGVGFFGIHYEYAEGFYDYLTYYINVLKPLGVSKC